MSSRFVANLAALLLLGVAVLAWILRYTEWFPAVGGVLALGGALSWLGFVSRILKKERAQELQDWADLRLFDNRWTLPAVVLLGVVGLIGASFVGTVELQSDFGGAGARAVTVRRAGGDVLDSESLSRSLRIPCATSWWSPQTLRLKVSGVPEAEVTVRPWRRIRLVAPTDFLRPAVILKPEGKLLEMLPNNPLPMVIRVESAAGATERTVARYHGETVWVGCDDEVDVPARIADAWKADLTAQGRLAFLHLWSWPIMPGGTPLPTQAGDRVRVRIKGSGGDYAATDFVVRPVRMPRDFPQEEEIHAN